MVALLAVAALLTSLADHWTTWLCLREAVPGFQVAEANPLAAWLFARAGLTESLLLDSLATAVALAILARSRLPRPTRALLLAVVCAVTSLAALHNLAAAHQLGRLEPLTLGGLP